jgi:hypothetical protein
MSDQRRLSWALVLSVLLHGLLLSLLPLIRRVHLEFPQPAQLLDVDVLPLPKPAAPRPPLAAPPAQAAPAAPAVPLPKQQIVSPPDQGEEKEPENARFLSDRNNTVKEERIHRGEPAPGDPDSAHKAPPQPVAKPNPERAHAAEPERARSNPQLAALPKLDQLLPSAGDLIREGVVRPEAAAPPPAVEAQASKQRNDLLSHGDPWRGRGRGGSMDFLPAIREGDITLLNTKAEQFAPFVRRVAVRVFENFIILLRRSYANGEVSAEEEVSVEAVMDKSGRLVSLTTKERSATSALATDRSLQSALHEGFFDRNPPPGAESNDGNIHFMFVARVIGVADPSGRRVPAWALLGTGLL